MATATGPAPLRSPMLDSHGMLTPVWSTWFRRIGSSAVSFDDSGITASAAEINILDGVTSSTAELNILDGVTSSATELNILDGVTSSASELNILDGVTATASELNILDGATLSTTELNKLDGVLSTTDELNKLSGLQSTQSELNKLSGVAVTALEMDYRSITCRIADISTADDVWVVSPYTGNVKTVYTVINNAITGADAVLTVQDKAGNSMGTITITQASSAEGDVDSLSPSANQDVVAGDGIEIITDGGSTTACEAWITILIEIT